MNSKGSRGLAFWWARVKKPAQKAVEILGWQGVTKVINVFAFAHAAKCLGSEKLGAAGLILAAGLQFTALGNLLNDAFLSRRYRLQKSRRARQLLITAAATGRLSVALAILIPQIAVAAWLVPGLASVPAMVAGIVIVGSVFLQPGWLLVAQDRTHVAWRNAGVGSLVTSALLFSIQPSTVFVGADLWAIALGGLVGLGIGWKRSLEHDAFRFRINFRCRRYIFLLIRKSGWLFVMYLFSNVYLYSDILLLGKLGSVEQAGIYRPASMLAISFFQSASFIPLLLFPKLIDWAREGGPTLWQRQLQIGAFMLLGTVALTSVAILVSGPIFQLLYGPKFAAASGPFVLLLAARALGIVASVFTWGLIAHHRDLTMAVINGVGAVVAVVGSFLLIPHLGIWGPAISGLGCDTVMLVLAFYLSWRTARRT